MIRQPTHNTALVLVLWLIVLVATLPVLVSALLIAVSGFSGHGFKFGPLLGLALPGADARLPRWAAGQTSAPAALEAALIS